ncbi:MAG TPA: leucyl aminopeptidase [Candidatus Acidoferrales bacterium]|nr:leucyl aminopeptidase [Candidatus Acidoferrales bacterium]HTX57991.1 leucyl aminopeptidase [Candidatus Acidoferrales bacterium]
MQVLIAQDAPVAARAGALVVPVFTGGELSSAAKAVDAAIGGAVSDVLTSEEIKGKLAECALLHTKDKPFHRVLVVGLGERAKFEASNLARYAGAAVRYLGRRNVKELAIALPDEAKGNETACVSFVVEGAISGAFETTIYQEKPDKRIAVESVSILANGFAADAVKRGVERGTVLGEAVNFARRLAVTPSNDMTPAILADEAVKAAKDAGIKAEILDEARIREEKMGSFLSVAAGSAQPPKFIVLKYTGDPSSKELLALVGKGITFDTGGISLKPPERMEEMKYDMSGGAGVIAAMWAIGKLKPKLNVVGLVPATENMPGSKATKPGDIVKAMNGKTIEIINTDAEGRLILADGLAYANKLGATKIVDAATLTGACVIALGHAASAVTGNTEGFTDEFLAAAKPTGERYWQMPLYEDYATAMKSDIADLKNTGGRPGGVMTAAAFLKSFVDETPWVHLDIAGTAYLDNESAWLAKGPTGTPVRAFLSFVETLAGEPVVHGNGKLVSSRA